LREDKNGRTYYPHTIYESFIISKTKEVFEEIDKKEIEEKEFLKLNEKYFEKVNIGKSEDVSNSILEKVEELKFNDLSDFKLFEEDYPEVDVFIEVDNNAKRIWLEYQNIHAEEDRFKRKNEFLKIKKDFYDYVISILLRKAQKNLPPEISGIRFIPKEQLNEFYDLETGFKIESKASLW
jgi:CRISPR-associated endonuclease/helicase Cas3